MAPSSPPPSPPPTVAELEHGRRLLPKFNSDGLIGAIVTEAASGEVLMFAWMNAEALRATLETGIAHFWSRSRAKLWKKGEESGNLLTVREIRVDCDQDALWLRVDVEGEGRACHTGARSCFYRRVVRGGGEEDGIVLEPAGEMHADRHARFESKKAD
jgi:phosphoribosyl-AMP cyclohydrolase